MRNSYRPSALVERPMDFFVAFLVTFMGVYGFVDPAWPERFGNPIYWILTIEDIYLVSSGVTIMVALVLRQFGKAVTTSIIMEMFGWMFICAAAVVIVITSPWIPTIAIDLPDPSMQFGWTFLWAMLAVCAFCRFRYIRRRTKGGTTHV